MPEGPEVRQAVSSEPAHACKHHFEIQTQRPACKCQHLLWPRRIHALMGLVLTCFLLVHLSVCLTGIANDTYRLAVGRIEILLTHLPGFALIAIFIPFAIQACGGPYLLKKEGMKYNVEKCNRGGKLRFFLQRVSALVILFFTAVHVATMHNWGLHLVYRITRWSGLARYADAGLFHPNTAFASTVIGIREACSAGAPDSPMNLAMLSLTLLSVWAAAYHAANGAWTGGIIWKISGTRISKPLWGALCLCVGFMLFLSGSVAWYAFAWSAPAQAVITTASR